MTCLSIIAAMDEDRLIGSENRLPWHLPADMRWFRRHTLGKPIVMGRATFESLGCRPLPDRQNIVLTRQNGYHAAGAATATDLAAALQLAGEADEIMIIGGSSIYQQTLPLVDRLYLSQIAGHFHGDAWFPPFDRDDWLLVAEQQQPVDDKHPWAITFQILQRRH
jgi:dihydrofolate reductase